MWDKAEEEGIIMKTKMKKIRDTKNSRMAVYHCHCATERCRCGRPAIPGEGICYSCLGQDR